MIEYNLWIESPFSFTKAQDFLRAVSLQCQILPTYMPMKWGWTEPKTPFDPTHIEQLVFDNGDVDNVFWKRTGKNRATGAWMPNRKGRHGSTNINVYGTTSQEELLAYIKVASQYFEADISVLDSCAERYKEIGMLNGYAPSASTLYLRTIYHWLPDMPWAVVFGPAYIHMFGKERVLSTPAYKVEDLGPDMVFIQLTSRMEDIHKDYEGVMAARALAKKHLGAECFFNPERAYDYRESDLNGDGRAGKVFKVPTFKMKSE